MKYQVCVLIAILLAAGGLSLQAQESVRHVGKFEAWKNQAVLHDIELFADGSYKMDDRRGKVIGQGTYTYDAKTMKFTWTSGPYRDDKYTGNFQFEHKIRVSNRSYAVNKKITTTDDKTPSLGTYDVAGPPFVYFTLLPDGKYQTFNSIDKKLEGEGQYTFDPREKAVNWESGPNKQRNFYRAFTVEQRIVLDEKSNLRAERILK